MLGCHDFCGYYDWTFHHVRAHFGPVALETLWQHAIGSDSQIAYLQAAQADGLRGLLKVWTQTGEDEQCDWTFTLDEARNVLRWDMRACPSKGHLLANNLHADEDYCDHCMGWIAPLLAQAGIEVATHEHNHCGQCWAELRVKGKPYQALDLPVDIRKDPHWNHGHVGRFETDRWTSADAVESIRRVLARNENPLILSDAEFLERGAQPIAEIIVLSADESTLQTFASRYLSIAIESRPVLVHPFPPISKPIDFSAMQLPRPLPLLPLLIRAGVYQHDPHAPGLKAAEFARLLTRSLTFYTLPDSSRSSK